jgi:YD repeat-containing protein
MSADKYIPGLGKQFFIEPKHLQHTNSFSYEYSGDGAVKSITEKGINDEVVSITTFTYSPEGDVISSAKTMNGQTVTTSYIYDANGNLTGTTNRIS